MSKKNRRKTTDDAEDAADLRWLRKMRKKPRHARDFEEVVAETRLSPRKTRIRHRREVCR